MATMSTLSSAREDLAARDPRGRKVLSAYVDLSPSRMQGQAYMLAFRAACQTMRPTLPEDEREDFEKAAAQIDDYLTDHVEQRGLAQAIFAWPDSKTCLVVPLPKAMAEFVSWTDAPAVAPIQEVLDDFERYAVLLLDAEKARLFVIHLGAIEEQLEVVDEVPRRQATGGWYGLAQTRMARHREDHVMRHVKRAIEEASAALDRKPFDRLFLAGSEEAISMLRHHLPRRLADRLTGTLSIEMFASDAQVLEAASKAGEAAERATELADVRELVDAANARQAEVGLEATLQALEQGRVHRLLVAEPVAQSGWQCRSCGHITQTQESQCPACGSPELVACDLKEAAIERALEQAARVDIVQGEASDLLLERGGLAAWTRY